MNILTSVINPSLPLSNHLNGFGTVNTTPGVSGTAMHVVGTSFAMTHDGTTKEIHQDGIHIPGADRTHALNTTDTPLFIGGTNTSGAIFNEYTSSIDEVQIYDEALSEAQILSLSSDPFFWCGQLSKLSIYCVLVNHS